MRVGYSGTLITMGMVWYTIFFSLVIMNVSDAQGDMSQGDPMLASVITIGFILMIQRLFPNKIEKIQNKIETISVPK